MQHASTIERNAGIADGTSLKNWASNKYQSRQGIGEVVTGGQGVWVVLAEHPAAVVEETGVVVLICPARTVLAPHGLRGPHWLCRGRAGRR